MSSWFIYAKNKTRQTMTESPESDRQKHKDKLIVSQSVTESIGLVYGPKQFIYKCSYSYMCLYGGYISKPAQDFKLNWLEARVCRHGKNIQVMRTHHSLFRLQEQIHFAIICLLSVNYNYLWSNKMHRTKNLWKKTTTINTMIC